MPRLSETSSNTSLFSKDIAAGVYGIPPVLTDNNDGTFDVGACEVLLYDNATNDGALLKYSIASVAGVSTTIDVTNYLVVNYNAGSPVYQVTTDVSGINESDIIPIITIYNNNNDELHLLQWDSLGDGMGNKLHMRFVKTDRFGWESGVLLGESGDGNRYITSTAGVMWAGAVRQSIASSDTSTNPFWFWYKSSGVWTKTVTATGGQWNNSQYQGTDDLISLNVNEYTVNWIFRDFDSDGHMGMILGDEAYPTFASAIASSIPSDIPQEIAPNGYLIGRLIVEKDGTTAYRVDSEFLGYTHLITPAYGVIYGTAVVGSAVSMTGIASDTYQALLAGSGVLQGETSDILTVTSNTGSGLTIDSDATALLQGLVNEFDTLVTGSGYPTDGVFENVATTVAPAGGTGATLKVYIEGGIVKDVTVWSPGSGYSAGDTLTIADVPTVGTPSVAGTVDVRTVQSNSLPSTAALSVNAGGTGYSVGDLVMITTGDKNSIVRVTSDTGGTGVVDGITLVNGGSGYAISTVGMTTQMIAGFGIPLEGIYKIASSVSFTDSTATAHEDNGTMFVIGSDNVIKRLPSITWTRTISSTNVGSSSLSGSERLYAGDFVIYAFENRHSGSTNITLNNYSWTIDRQA